MSTQVAQASQPLKVLVIEDNAEDRELYRRLLEKKTDHHFEVYETDNAREGLALSYKERPDCIILDYQLPDATGLDFIQTFRDGNDQRTAIVMVTGQGSERTAVEAMRLGALDYITKTSIIEGFFIQSIMNAVERARLKGQIARYQEELEKSNRDLSEFAYTVSHDLKAPMRHLTSYCDLLKEELGEKLEGDQLQYINRMSINVARMQRMIDDLLAYSRALHSKEEKAPVDLNAVLQEVTDDFDPLIKSTGAKISVAKLPVIEAYPVRMKQLFQNLIGNALKYRSEKPPVIKVGVEDRQDHYLFSVEDNGLGIESKYLERIFKPFERLHSQEKIEGTGLGLSICKKVASMHNGKIWAESQPGVGTRFFLQLPKK